MRIGMRGARDERGAAAVEFSIVVILLLMLFYGIITYGFIFGLQHSIANAAAEGARAAIQKRTTAEQIQIAQDTARDRLGWLGPDRAAFTSVTATVDPCGNDPGYDCITVRIVYAWSTSPLVPSMFGIGSPDEIGRQATVQLDDPSSGGPPPTPPPTPTPTPTITLIPCPSLSPIGGESPVPTLEPEVPCPSPSVPSVSPSVPSVSPSVPSISPSAPAVSPSVPGI